MVMECMGGCTWNSHCKSGDDMCECMIATKWGAMVKINTAAIKKKPISFTTKDGKSIEFKSTGVKKVKATQHVKQLEKRLSAMEKAVMKYNRDVQLSRAKEKEAKGVGKKEKTKESCKDAETVDKATRK